MVGVGVGVTLEVRLHRLLMGENGRRESGKNAMVVNATTGIRIWYWRRGDIGGRECLSKMCRSDVGGRECLSKTFS